MKPLKLKSAILFFIIFLSQAHVLFRGLDFKIEWIINGKIKTVGFAAFLLFVHLRFFVFSYIMMKPKGVSKDVPLFLFIVSVMDLLHFILLSGYGYGEAKILLSFLIFAVYKYCKR